MTVDQILVAIDHSVAYRIALFYFGFYPIFMAIVWIIMGITYFRRREKVPETTTRRSSR